MVRSIRFITLVLIMMLCFSGLEAQTFRKFSEDSLKFLEEMTSFFKNVNNRDKKIAEELMNDFTEVWHGDFFDHNEKLQIIKTSNAILKRKMKQIPHFYDFISTIIAFAISEQPASSFNAWHRSLDQYISKSSSKYLLEYLKQCRGLLIDNAIYSSRATQWKTDNNNYYFEYDADIRIVFPSLNLKCYANHDSALIFNTKGVYDPVNYKWIGEGGNVNWVRAGLEVSKVYANLGVYDILMKFSKYKADSVIFTNELFFNKPLLGAIEEKVLANVTPEKASYPRFTSYDKRIRVENIFENIDYEGGFTMRGARFLGAGGEEQDAKLFIKKDGVEFVVISAETYTIRNDRIASSRAAVTIYFKEDSIFHPGLQMRYMEKSKELTLFRSQGGISDSPFFNSYHKVDMYCEQLSWKITDDKIDFSMIKGVTGDSRALFESENYYTDYKYYRLQGIDEIHPLLVLNNYSKKFNTKVIQLPNLVKYWNTSREQAEPVLIRLANMGFILYDIKDGMVLIKDRLYHYLDSKNKKTDYDVIQFQSVISAESNATLSLIDFDLLLRGVSRVYLSDTQLVYIYPHKQEIVLKKNRDFTFDGQIHAGLFDFYAHNCFFEYDKFKIDLPTIDSMRFKVYSFKPNEYGKYELKDVKTVISDLSGDILIDHPNNKSGLKPYKDFPIFNSKEDCYVYYDKKNIQKGVYSRDNFYYHVYPFTIDSLVRFETEGLEFEGYLTSAGIFPNIEEPLKVMKDYSLGFEYMTPMAGLPIFGGKGQYTSKIDLSHNGLRGDGTLEYLTSAAKSNDYYFYPDSLNTVAQSFVVTEQLGAVQYPDVNARDVYIHWMPYEDVMTIKKVNNPIPIYKAETRLHGQLALTPSSMTGKGRLEFDDADLRSNLFSFKHHEIDADTADFNLKSYDLEDFSFSTHNYKAHVDLEERVGNFIAIGGASLVEFPVNQYICYMDEFDWYMDQEEIAMVSKVQQGQFLDNMTEEELVDVQIKGSEFISIHPAQDSLRFYTTKGRFNLRNHVIVAEDVKLIRVADAAVYPYENKITILKKAEMETLNKATILANTTTKYHKIYNAVINIHGRFEYSAMGNYDYMDMKKTTQQIYFSEIGVDTTGQTYGKGQILESQQFSLSPYFNFNGDVTLLANNEFLTFRGGSMISHDCDTLPRFWLKFESEIDPDDVMIPISSEIKDIKGNKLASSLMFSHTQNKVYPAFLSPIRKYSDTWMLPASGFLTFDEVSKEYRISNREKLVDLSQHGNYLSLSTRNCITYGEGRIDLGTDLGQLKMMTYGNTTHWMAADSTEARVVMLLDFYFNNQAMEMLGTSLVGYLLEPIGLSDDIYTKALVEILGQEDADEALSDLNLYGFIRSRKILSRLEHTLFLTDVNLVWNNVTKSFISTGQIGIGNVGKTEVNKYVEGNIEIAKKRSGDIITIYLKPDESEWYFFSYGRGLMQAISSEKEFNNFIVETKPEKRKMDTKSGETPYRYLISTLRKRSEFLRKLATMEINIDEDEESEE